MTLYSRDAAERLLAIATEATNIVETDSAHLAQLAETIIALYDRLAPTPQIIRTTNELTAIDPDTVLLGEESILFTAADCVENSGFPLYDNDQLAVVATGDQVRAARQALEEKRPSSIPPNTTPKRAKTTSNQMIPADLKALLPTPPQSLKTLADMTADERAACQWMQADTARGRVVIIAPDSSDGYAKLLDQGGGVTHENHELITPRPDLPRMTWPVDQEATPATTPPDRWRIADQEDAPETTPPDKWRLADHPEYGRVIVIRPTPRIDGKVLFIIPDSDPLGYDRRLCKPDELTFLNNDQEA